MEQEKATAKQRRQQQGCTLVSDGLRDRAAASSSAASAAAATAAARAEPKGIAAFFKPKVAHP